MTAAGLTTEQFADRLGVDVKTVRRWTYGRIPYPRHRIAISHALELSQHELWPELPGSATTGQADTEGLPDLPDTDPVVGYPASDHPAIPPLEDLIAAASTRIDISDDSLLPPPPGADPRLYAPSTQLAEPALLPQLAAKSQQGVRIRVLVGRVDRDLASLLDLPNVELRLGDARHSIHRGDDQLLLGITGVALTNDPRPVLHVHRHTTGGLFDRLLEGHDADWESADAIASVAQLNQYAAEIEAERERDREHYADASADETDEPELERGPARPARRWPRRPEQELGG